ncbi:thioredoxin domain-containing protein [Acidocella sp.]|uniref:thioredoxin domain-containing protein n=1 Tax=Acidocella sp. TaxID=50710 RepID=UPI002620BC07|nr:thioredoxin domain-containing protein [Acidocella sp.]
MRNRLGEASSPYLLQHKDNPVHWHIWGEEAFAEARARDVPVLLSIGYAACHWCHVMAHESFESPAIAALMNEHFVCIKVDREERPDIDQIYMTALQAMGQPGGWPLTMALTPEGAPFWGGTYFPPAPRFGQPGFPQVLVALARAWAQDRERLLQSAAAFGAALGEAAAPRPGDPPGPALLAAVRGAFLRGVDWEQGGLGGAPKFPNIPVFRFLWAEYFRTGEADCARATHLLLERMSQGGIYDHLGGGYARYATDAAWLVPHFEKMLYDNALILEMLALAQADRPGPLYAARARETVGWLTRDMRAEGAFAASEDADSEGEEGRFYVWSRAEIEAVLGGETEFFARHYPLPAAGNWEGKIILERRSGFGAEEARLAACRARLLAAREKRVRPGRDDKVLADWNALAVAALVKAGVVFGEPGWVRLAAEVFAALRAGLGQPDGRIAHAMRQGRVSAAGLLEDQAAMIRAALALYQATGAAAYLGAAETILAAAEARFSDGAGAFFTTADDAADVFTPRGRSAQDGPTPSGIGMMAANYAVFYHLTGRDGYRARAEAALAAYGGDARALAAAPSLLLAAGLLANAACVVVTGEAEDLLETALAAADPAVLVLRGGGELAPGHPAHGKPAGARAAYICQAGMCGPVVGEAAALRAALRRKADEGHGGRDRD